jgi:hypothetical protein
MSMNASRQSKAQAIFIPAVAVIFGLMVAPAAAADRQETVHFARGKTSTTLSGTIRGYDGVRYTLGAVAGQTMSVLFKPGNRSCYMNVWAPNTDTAAFIGSTSGDEYSANLTASGDYAIQVYLMRNAARRNESCRYSAVVEITGAPGGTSVGTSDSVMKDVCRSQAAVDYGVKAGQISLGAVVKHGDGFQIDGSADKGAEGKKKLRCLFKADRSFIHIMAMTSDGE